MTYTCMMEPDMAIHVKQPNPTPPKLDIPSLQEIVRAREKTGRKVMISIRLDHDVVERYRGTGPGWQTLINDILRKVMEK